MKYMETAQVLAQEALAGDIYSMYLNTEQIAKEAKPGQFISVYSRDGASLLPRPISICEINEQIGALRLVYRVAGAGTREFCGYEAGDSVSVLGVLGNGFPLEQGMGKKVFLMGGGIGVPPILELAKRLEGDKQIILGYRDQKLFLKDDLKQNGRVYVATEDGTVGTRGNVMDAIRENGLEAEVIFACGPMPMLRAIKAYAAKKGIPAYISLEEHMACGVGACLGCVVKTKEIDGHSNVDNARICTEGPVFEAAEVEI